MSEYGGVGMMMKKAVKKMGNRTAPRAGAAKSMGHGQDGYRGAAVSKAMRECGGPAPKFYPNGSASSSYKVK